MSDVANWYSGKKILITGVTGFVGKVLVEKLLRSCPDIDTIFLFVRLKKGKTIQERKDSVFQNVFFDPIRSINPELLNKVVLINAALTKDDLSLSPEDENTLINNCDIVFHNAASVQFDRGIHEICETNVAGLKNLLELCKRMKHLKAFVFCSTAFSQYTGLLLEEKGYDPPIEPEQLSQILDTFDEDLINPLTTKILGRHGNTYSFSKAIAEHLCKDYNQYFPVAIARPSIVCNIAYDPLPGWTEGLNSFNGSGILALFGVLKLTMFNISNPRNIIPVDVVVNGLILIGWQACVQRHQVAQYINLAEDVSLASQHLYSSHFQECENGVKRYPAEISIMLTGSKVIQNYWYFKLLELWYHYLPALLIDFLLFLCRKKPMLVGIQRKLQYQMQIAKYYTSNPFMFRALNLKNLEIKMNDHDKLKYPVDVTESFHPEYSNNSILGIRKYLLKQSNESIPKGRRLQRIFEVLQYVMFGLFGYWIINYVLKKIALGE